MGVHAVDFICLLVGWTGTSLSAIVCVYASVCVCLDGISIPESYLHCVLICASVWELWSGMVCLSHNCECVVRFFHVLGEITLHLCIFSGLGLLSHMFNGWIVQEVRKEYVYLANDITIL